MVLQSSWSMAQNRTDCDCSGEETIVCAVDEVGNLISLPACLATCLNVETVECESDMILIDQTYSDSTCFCTLEYLPVCALDSDNRILKFPNACMAACNGYSTEDIFRCTQCYAVILARPTEDSGKTWSFGSIVSGNINHYVWDFGDGLRSDESNPIHTYETNGEYGITLTIISDDLCVYQANARIKVGDCQCPDIHDPVCVQNDEGVIIRFSNSCEAECEGYDRWGSCYDCICPEIYDPVCAISSSGDTLQFDNPCFASCVGYNDFFDCSGECLCSKEYVPVCVTTTTMDTLTFDNKCLAECAGYFDYYLCDVNCFCPAIYDPVCVYSNDEIITFSNRCEAECQGYLDFFSCQQCECYDEGYNPVCVILDNGQIEQFVNKCFAAKAGYFNFSDCANSCDCPTDEYIPVCVNLDNGCTLTFENECRAKCQGFYEFNNCNDCLCTDIYAPVCVKGDNGQLIIFGNSCEAECKGYLEYRDCSSCELCPDIIDPVCAVSTDGDIIRIANACVASCEGINYFDCDDEKCDCSDVHDPVCVITDFGDIIEYENKCLAECHGHTDIFECERDCHCEISPDEDFVCVISDEEGNICPFPNLCFAKCAGYSEEDVVSCADDIPWGECMDCFYDPIKPICVFFEATGDIIIAPNKCFASCLNLQVVDCASDSSGLTPDERDDSAPKDRLFTAEVRNNLTDRRLRLVIDASDEIKIQLKLFNISGYPILQKEVSVIEGENEYDYDLYDLSSGMYFVRLQSRGSSQMVRFLLLD